MDELAWAVTVSGRGGFAADGGVFWHLANLRSHVSSDQAAHEQPVAHQLIDSLIQEASSAGRYSTPKPTGTVLPARLALSTIPRWGFHSDSDEFWLWKKLAELEEARAAERLRYAERLANSTVGPDSDALPWWNEPGGSGIPTKFYPTQDDLVQEIGHGKTCNVLEFEYPAEKPRIMEQFTESSYFQVGIEFTATGSYSHNDRYDCRCCYFRQYVHMGYSCDGIFGPTNEVGSDGHLVEDCYIRAALPENENMRGKLGRSADDPIVGNADEAAEWKPGQLALHNGDIYPTYIDCYGRGRESHGRGVPALSNALDMRDKCNWRMWDNPKWGLGVVGSQLSLGQNCYFWATFLGVVRDRCSGHQIKAIGMFSVDGNATGTLVDAWSDEWVYDMDVTTWAPATIYP